MLDRWKSLPSAKRLGGVAVETLRSFGISGEVVVVPCQVRLGVSVKAGRWLAFAGRWRGRS